MTTRFKKLLVLSLALIASVVILAVHKYRSFSKQEAKENHVEHHFQAPKTLKNLMVLTDEGKRKVEIALVNMLCAEDLPGAQDVRVRDVERTIKQMAHRVRIEIARNFHQFRKSPQDFENSEAHFRMLVLATVLHEDFGVRYNPRRITEAGAFESNESFFADSRDVFIHGLLFGKRMGTCSSIPVLYVAVGRELGFPLKLVTAKNHLFVRWEDSKERKNFETTGEGLNSFDDDYYRKWPLPMTQQEEKRFGYLKSLTSREELGVFLSIRASCLVAAGRKKEGETTLIQANQFLPLPRLSDKRMQTSGL